MSREILYLSRADVEAAALPMTAIIERLEAAFVEKGGGRTEMPPKPGIHPGPPGNDNFIHAMPALIGALGAAGVKWVSGFPGNAARGLPYISGLLILNDVETGVQIAAVQLQDVEPPEAVAAAFKDVTNAKEDREKLINQAIGYRNDILPKAKGEAAQMVNQAKGYAQARLNRAQGEANRFLATLKEYNQARDTISKRIYIETMEEILPKMDKIIIDGKAGERMLPYLPIDRVSKKPPTSGEGRER